MYAGQVNASTASNSTVNHPDQMKEPFRAFGNLSYMGGDYYYTKNGKSEKIGQISYEYDAQGNTLKRESSMRNVDGSVIKSLFAEWESIVPDDAAFYDVQIYNGRDKEASQLPPWMIRPTVVGSISSTVPICAVVSFGFFSFICSTSSASALSIVFPRAMLPSLPFASFY